MSDSSITLLAALITSSVANLQKACNTYGVHLSSPTEPFRSQDLDPFAYSAITEASSIIVSAAAQLIAIVRPPTNTIVNTALQFHVSSSLRAAVVTNVPEILQEAGDNVRTNNHSCRSVTHLLVSAGSSYQRDIQNQSHQSCQAWTYPASSCNRVHLS